MKKPAREEQGKGGLSKIHKKRRCCSNLTFVFLMGRCFIDLNSQVKSKKGRIKCLNVQQS
jgi:hypothetical protein